MIARILAFFGRLFGFRTKETLVEGLGGGFNGDTNIEIPLEIKTKLEAALRKAHAFAGPMDDATLARLMRTAPARESSMDGQNILGDLFVETGPRRTWKNQIKNQVVQPLNIFRPDSLYGTDNSLVAILQRALRSGCVVKAAGSGHSYSDVATTPDFFINTHSLNRISDEGHPIAGQLSQSELTSKLPLGIKKLDFPHYDPEKNRALVETECGITIHDLNRKLEDRNLGLMNMGGYDGQTIIGAISTSTHGSGISLGPFPDMVRSLVLVTTGKWNGTTIGGKEPANGVYVYRIEPSRGITDPTRYSDPTIQLIQDDDCFHATICNMGCFGVIYSVVLEVMQMYWLEEDRTLYSLDQVFALLAPNLNNAHSMPDLLTTVRNCEILVHPYPMKDGKVVDMDLSQPPSTYYPLFQSLITRRNIAPKPNNIFKRKGHRNFIVQLMGRFDLTFEAVVALINRFPHLIPDTITSSLKGVVDKNYTNKSYDIYLLGLNGDAGFAAEIGFSMTDENGNYTDKYFKAAVDQIHRTAQRARLEGQQYQTSPFSLRFVKASSAHLSMMQGVNTCMIEMDMVTGTYGGIEVMQRYEHFSFALGGRPHWGLEFDYLNGNNGLIAKMYPQLECWLDVYRQFNALGTFNNSFTDRLGFEAQAYRRERMVG